MALAAGQKSSRTTGTVVTEKECLFIKIKEAAIKWEGAIIFWKNKETATCNEI